MPHADVAHGWLMLMPSRSTTLTPSERMVRRRLAIPSSRRLISSTYKMPRCASASRPGVAKDGGWLHQATAQVAGGYASLTRLEDGLALLHRGLDVDGAHEAVLGDAQGDLQRSTISAQQRRELVRCVHLPAQMAPHAACVAPLPPVRYGSCWQGRPAGWAKRRDINEGPSHKEVLGTHLPRARIIGIGIAEASIYHLNGRQQSS